jgi:hypothetical protein
MVSLYSTVPIAHQSFFSKEIMIWPPVGVYLMALEIKLVHNCTN